MLLPRLLNSPVLIRLPALIHRTRELLISLAVLGGEKRDGLATVPAFLVGGLPFLGFFDETLLGFLSGVVGGFVELLARWAEGWFVGAVEGGEADGDEDLSCVGCVVALGKRGDFVSKSFFSVVGGDEGIRTALWRFQPVRPSSSRIIPNLRVSCSCL